MPRKQPTQLLLKDSEHTLPGRSGQQTSPWRRTTALCPVGGHTVHARKASYWHNGTGLSAGQLMVYAVWRLSALVAVPLAASQSHLLATGPIRRLELTLIPRFKPYPRFQVSINPDGPISEEASWEEIDSVPASMAAWSSPSAPSYIDKCVMTIRNFHQLRVLGRSHGVGHWLLLPVLFVAASLDQLGLVRLASDSIMRRTPGSSACTVKNLCGSAYKTVSLCVCVWVFACLGRRAGQSCWAELLGQSIQISRLSARDLPRQRSLILQ